MPSPIPFPERPRPPLTDVPPTLTPALRLQLLRICDELLSWTFFVLAQSENDTATTAVLTHLQAAQDQLDQARQAQRQTRED